MVMVLTHAQPSRTIPPVPEHEALQDWRAVFLSPLMQRRRNSLLSANQPSPDVALLFHPSGEELTHLPHTTHLPITAIDV